MAKIDAIDIPKLLFTEGAAPGTPASGKVHQYAKADGLLYSKDDAGVETLMSSGASGGINSGTSFPGSPATDAIFYRTDRDLLYFYDGTRWLTVHLYEHFLAQFSNDAATTGERPSAVHTATYDVYVEKLIATMFSSGLSGTAYWTINMYYYDGATQGSVIATVNSQSGVSSSFERKSATINALMGTAKDAITIQAVKTLSPGNLFGGAMLTYRLVG